MNPSADAKSTLRRELAACRDRISAASAASAAAKIAEYLTPRLAGREPVAAFSATRNEVDLAPLYQKMLAAGVTVCFPRVEGPGAMVFAEVETLADLQPGAYGILEPTGPALPIETIEVFLVPGLGFDRHGARLGFGGGYYDRALSGLREVCGKVPLLLGIGYSCQVLDTELPTDDWDVRLDSVITEAGVIAV